MEARAAIRSAAQQVSNQIGKQLAQCQRIYDRTSGPALLARLDLAGLAPLAGTQLPQVEESGALSPGAAGFVQASVGNSLLFASAETPSDLEGMEDSGGVPRRVRVDTFVFNYYFLTSDASQSIAQQPRILFQEWRTAHYANYEQLAALMTFDLTLGTHTVAALYAAGFRHSWNPAASDLNSAFFTLTASGLLPPDASHTLRPATLRSMIQIVAGVSGVGFRTGVAPNGLTVAVDQSPVPLFAASNGLFPSGFEVLVVGPRSARQVLSRLVLTAEGPFRERPVVQEMLITSAHDY